MSGWLVEFPLTSGLVVFFLALEQGAGFGAAAIAAALVVEGGALWVVRRGSPA